MNGYLAKLMISVFMISDTGSLATSNFATDFPAHQCDQLAKEFADKKTFAEQGHNVTVVVKAICVPIEGAPVARRSGPPPEMMGLLQMFNGLARER